MKVLVVGGGGREHSLCWGLARSPRCSKLYCAPGNAGIAALAECVEIAADDLDGLVAFATEQAIDFVVVGPEAPLVLGLVDRLESLDIKVFGCSAKAAVLEGSKGFMKDLCGKYQIPSADYARFDEPEAAKEYIRRHGVPLVVKADGLAAGKGVVVARTLNEAYAAVDMIMSERAFGEAGDELVIEEFLTGEEASFFALVDGETALPLVAAQDHKAALDGDKGPNTGGMGAYSPAPVVTPAMTETIMATIVTPTIKAMAAEGRPFKGVLFCGLMIEDGVPRVLEYNVRFGDPECQVLMMRFESDVLEALLAAAEGRLAETQLRWSDHAALVVVMATQGYPGPFKKGSVIADLDAADALEGVTVFHAGTALDNGRVISNGGRVLGVTARAPTIAEAQRRAYLGVDTIHWPEGHCRRDIGWRAIARETSS